MLPSPAAAATLLAGFALTSPTAKTPGRLVSYRWGARPMLVQVGLAGRLRVQTSLAGITEGAG
jgi:hypothetical protein